MTGAAKTVKALTSSVEETRRLGAKLAKTVCQGDVFSLNGNIGSGKTEFVRGFVEALSSGVNVRSPTFSIVNTYPAPDFSIHHFDFYRIEDVREFSSIGLDEYINGDGVCLIEWGEMYPEVLPESVKRINFLEIDETTRAIETLFGFC
ncbi:MAG: tRNA (adenosine(37)-N6)-threonylcarbamoyltransferase complex ATPase subunit type 1 TsaE [Chitinispirillales bacterium]|jgi:tRNA threonylcarbamoyladenosine biosynthesis protein TsaE|nr:tRNA (adenosine(37)-N6)-threonylcarbamoyltransferase complex ATPase subunit type 1 TsaE [Chitinispirillales bacterium]